MPFYSRFLSLLYLQTINHGRALAETILDDQSKVERLLDELAKEREVLAQEKELRRKDKESLKGLASSLKSLRTQMTALEKEKVVVTDYLDGSKEKISELRAEAESAAQQAKAMRLKISSLEAPNEDATKKVDDLNSQLNIIRKKADDARVAKQASDLALERSREEVAKAEEEVRRTKAEATQKVHYEAEDIFYHLLQIQFEELKEKHPSLSPEELSSFKTYSLLRSSREGAEEPTSPTPAPSSS